MINPAITETSGRQDGPEACLSIPGITATLDRAAYVVVAGVDLRQQPVTVTVTGDGELARCLQHETGHLRGELYIDRSPAPGTAASCARSAATPAPPHPTSAAKASAELPGAGGDEPERSGEFGLCSERPVAAVPGTGIEVGPQPRDAVLDGRRIHETPRRLGPPDGWVQEALRPGEVGLGEPVDAVGGHRDRRNRAGTAENVPDVPDRRVAAPLGRDRAPSGMGGDTVT